MKGLLLVGVAVAGIVTNCAGMAADIAARKPVKAGKAVQWYDWTGPYVGFHFGYGGGSFGANTNPLPAQGVFFPATTTGLVGGYQIGYNFQAASGLVLGVEADATFISTRVRPIFVPFSTTFNYFASARARLAYAYGALLPYVTAGLAWGSTLVSLNDESGEPFATRSLTHPGWVAGIGVEFPLTGKWTGRYEYDYISLAPKTYSLDIPVAPSLAVDPKVHVVKLGLNYRLWGTPPDSAIYTKAPEAVWPTDPGWSIHGQTTFIAQAYPSFRSPYEGEHSLPGKGQGRETWTATAFIGRALWEGGELYFNPELDQGFGLNTTLGLAGFANGEAQKGGAPYPRFRPQRYFFRQTFGLGGEQETVEDAANQIAGKRDIDRITLTVGRFAVGDYFDANGYAHDPRADFLNWSLWESAAYDFPADLPGFTRGAVVELNRKSWALRAGLFQVPSEPNSDTLLFKTGGAVLEWEGRYSIFGQGGKVRVGTFANRGNTGNYREALAIAAADPAADINDVMSAIRRQRPKYGFYANMEQALGKDLGVFARASWNDGRNEILSFTDIDWSVAGGVSIGGSSWGREADRIGIGAAVNGLSAAHRDFLAAGGLGLLIGDGTINYRPESILETYYAYRLNPATTLTLDYQFIADPAHNADRGPVSIFAFRGHAEF